MSEEPVLDVPDVPRVPWPVRRLVEDELYRFPALLTTYLARKALLISLTGGGEREPDSILGRPQVEHSDPTGNRVVAIEEDEQLYDCRRSLVAIRDSYREADATHRAVLRAAYWSTLTRSDEIAAAVGLSRTALYECKTRLIADIARRLRWL